MNKKKDLYRKISDVKRKINNLRTYFEEQSERQDMAPQQPLQSKKSIQHISLSAPAIFKIALISLLTFYFLTWLGSIADILLTMFAAIIIASAFIPIVDYFQKRHIPRAITVLVIYIAFFAMFGFVISNIIPFFVEQLSSLIDIILNSVRGDSGGGFEGLPYGKHLEIIVEHLNKEQVIDQIQGTMQDLAKRLGEFSGSFIGWIGIIMGNVFRAIMILVLTFYMIIEKDAVSDFFRNITAGPHQDWIIARATEVVKKMGDWLRGQVILSISVGVFAYIGLLIIGNPFALTLGFLTALLEFIPYIGPILAGVIAGLISLTISPLAALLTVILYAILQFLENNILVPMIMRKAVGLSPIASIFAILVAVKMIGGPGIMLAIPMAAAVAVFINSFFSKGVPDNLDTGNGINLEGAIEVTQEVRKQVNQERQKKRHKRTSIK